MYTTDSDLKDQDDLIENVLVSAPSRCIDADGNPGDERKPANLKRFHRTVNQRGSTVHFGAGFGWRVRSNLSVGFGASYIDIDELVQEYQDVRTELSLCKTDGSTIDMTEQKSQNIRQRLQATGLRPVFSLQYIPVDRLSIGVTLKQGLYLQQTFEQGYESRSTNINSGDQSQIDNSKNIPQPITSTALAAQSNDTIIEADNPLGSMPLELGIGAAFFYSTRLLLTFDVNYHSAVKDNKTDGDLGKRLGDLYSKEAVINMAIGGEFYVLPSVVFRAGFFSNNDARPEIDENKAGQRDHIDYNGLTSFISWVQPNSQIGLGFVLQRGEGKAQKVGGVNQVQAVEAESSIFAFSATHSF